MRVDLKVTHTPDLKSKQPWPQLCWQGNQINNILLIDQDSQRLKVFCMTQSGKGDTKKKVARLQSRLQHICTVKVSSCGNFLVCLQYSGDMLVWHKDSDKLQTIYGVPELVSHSRQQAGIELKSPKPQIFISSNAQKILVVIGCSKLFLWEMDQSGGPTIGKQANAVRGRWTHISASESHVMPSSDCKEAVPHAQFFTDEVLGDCCICSFVFNHRNQIHVTSVILRWTAPQFIYSVSQPRFIAQWDSLQYPISGIAENCRPVRHHGAFVAQHSHRGSTLAVAVNQRSPFSNRVTFLSVMASGAVIVDLKGCGCTVKKPNLEYARSYWIGDMSWTADDLFLACITKRGSVAILSRLGEPLILQSEGCSVEYGPQLFLPFHPLITVVPSNQSASSATNENQPSPTSSIKSETDEKRQRFSIATHPTKPIIVCSDGYLATVMELPESLTCTSLMADFLSEGRTALNMLSEKQEMGLRRLNTIKIPKTLRYNQTLQQTHLGGSQGFGTLRGSIKAPKSIKHDLLSKSLHQTQLGGSQEFGTSKGLIATAGSETDYMGPYSNLNEGRILFGYPLEYETTRKVPTREGGILSATSQAQRALFSTLGLGLSYSGAWTSKLDSLLLLTVKSIVRLCEVILLNNSQPVSALGVLNRKDREVTLQKICALFQGGLNIFLWDMNYHNSQSTALKMSHWIVKALIRHAKFLPTWLAPRSCVAMLQFSERILTNVYTMVPAQQPSFHIAELSFHQGDFVEGAYFSSSGRTGHIYTYVDGSERTGYSVAQPAAKAPIMCVLGKRLIKSWKLLHEHLNKQYAKLLTTQDPSITQGRRSRGSMRKQRQLLTLLCGVQRKLHHLGWTVPLSFSQLWVQEIHKGFLKGCEWYINGYAQEAIQTWHLTSLQAQTYQTIRTPNSTSSSSTLESLTEKRPQHQQVSGTPLLTASLVAILYTYLENYDLLAALKLTDKLIHCYQGDSKVKGHRTKKGTPTKLVRTGVSFLETIRKSGKVHFTAILPCVPLEEHRAVVACLARWMALYFTNQPLYIYPACSAILMPSLLRSEQSVYGTPDQPRVLPLYHDRISSAIRHQDMSDVWTADTALSLFLVCGLVPEAVWLAKELGDWKSAFTLAVLYSEQNSWVIQLPSSIDSKELVLPGHLTPDAIMKEGLGSLLQTSNHTPSKSKLERTASVGRGRDKTSILKVPTAGSHLKRTSSMRRRIQGKFKRFVPYERRGSIHDEDKASQEQRSRSLTDMLTAATLIGLDPTLWLLGNLTDACLSLVAEFNTLVPDDFYLPAPPYYCPQPEYIPKDHENDVVDLLKMHDQENEAEQVLHEVEIRCKVNDVIQVLLLVLNSSSCSLPCTKWYVYKLGTMLKKESKKKKGAPVQLPQALGNHTKYPLDLLDSKSSGGHLPAGLSKLLQCFRNLCTMVWVLHARDRLSIAIRQYQARREKSLRVKPEDPDEISQHKMLLMSIIEWAGCLHPFMKYLQMEDEIQDVLLTAISELPTNKQTVNILARYFHSGEDGLYPAVTEKFSRLMEKLKRKREVADKKQRKQEERRDEKGKKTVKYETLYRYYKRQCQKRKVELNNRKDILGSFEEHVFDPDTPLDATYISHPDKPSTSPSSLKDSMKDTLKKFSRQLSDSTGRKVQLDEYHEVENKEPVSPRQTAHSHPRQKKLLRQTSFTEEDFLPVVGSREFESSPLYLDFLETFFLVAFGKIIQNLSPSTKPDAPLLGMYSEQLKKQELNPVVAKMLGRQKAKIELDISSTLRLPSDSSNERSSSAYLDMYTSDTDDVDNDVIDQDVPFRGLFKGLGRKTEASESVLNETMHRKIFDDHGYSVPSTPTPRSKTPSKDFQLSGTFLHNESKPYTNIRLNLGKKFQKHVDLLQWLSRWTERQQRLYYGGGVGGPEGSKAVLRVQLPQQLMLNALWLLENCYYPELFQRAVDIIAMPTTEESTLISTTQRVRFDEVDGRRLKDDGGGRRLVEDDGGKEVWTGSSDISVVQALLKPSSSSEDLLEDNSREIDDDVMIKMRGLLRRNSKKSKKARRARSNVVRSSDATATDSHKEVASKTKSRDTDRNDDATATDIHKGNVKVASKSKSRHTDRVDEEIPPKAQSTRSSQKKTRGDGGSKETDKRKKKKRQLPEVTAEHLSSAVDYKTEAQKARERLTSPRAFSPSSTSQTLSVYSNVSQSDATRRRLDQRNKSQGLSAERDGVTEDGSKDQPDGQQGRREIQKRKEMRLKEEEERKRATGLEHDSDSSSLDVSSLEEDEIAVLQKEVVGAGDRVANPGLSLKSSPTDVRKMVRDEFRKMMGKSIFEMLNSTTTPEDNKTKERPTLTSDPTTESKENPTIDHVSLLHPQAHTGQSDRLRTGSQAPQGLLHTWHGEESMLHKGAKSVTQDKNNRRAIGNVPVKETKDKKVRPIHDKNSVLNNFAETQDKTRNSQSANMPSDTSGNSIPLTLQDLDTNQTSAPRQRENSNNIYQNGAQNTLPNNVEINRNNNANFNSQNVPQNGHRDNEYDTIPTRDSDEFVPSNSSSSPQEGATGQASNERDPRQGPPPSYHNTYSFANPQMPPLLRLDGPYHPPPPHEGPYHPPPPPHIPHGFPPFSPREVWEGRDMQPQTTNRQRNEFPYDRPLDDHASYRHGGQYQDHHANFDEPRQENSSYFLPRIPLLTLDNRGPLYQPPPTGPSSQNHIPSLDPPNAGSSGPRPPGHMPLLTLDPRPSSQHQHGMHRHSHLPYTASEANPKPVYHPSYQSSSLPPASSQEAPTNGHPQYPMPLLHLDEPPQPYLFKSSRGGVGSIQLIPPEEIIAYEEQKYKDRVEKLRKQQENAEELAEGQIDGSHLPLLHLDDVLDDVSRQRRKSDVVKPATEIHTEKQPSTRKASSSKTKSRRKQPKPVESTTTATSTEEDASERDTVAADRGRRKKGDKGKTKTTKANLDERNEEVSRVDKNKKLADGRNLGEEKNRQTPSPSSMTVDDIMEELEEDKGYAIKPGTYDAMLEQPDSNARPSLQPSADSRLPPSLQPTSAEVHLSVVRQLQEPPKPSSRDAASMTRQQRDVATSMDTNGLPVDTDSRFGKSTDPVSQYTTAATGISNAGRIVAPDIFFGLRFGSKPDTQAQVTDQDEPNKDRNSKPSDKGHDFISVVDMDSEAIGELLQQPEQPEIVSKHRLDEPERDTEDGVGQRAVDSNTGPEPSVAELHYNSLFHRDAHTRGLSPISAQQAATEEEEGGPDAVTEKVLQTKPSVKAIRNRSQSARDQSKQRVYQRLAEMAEQLDAIDEVSKHMEDDFKNTKLMLNTVEQLSETMTSTVNRPKPSGPASGHPLPKPSGSKTPSGPPASGHPSGPTASRQPFEEQPEVQTNGSDVMQYGEDVAEEEATATGKKLHVTIKDDREEEEDIPERGPKDDTAGEDVLGITGLSGVSDIIAEALADEDAKDLGISEETRHKLQAKRAKKQQEPEPEFDTLDLTTLTQDQLKEIFSPRSLLTTNDDDDEELFPSYAKKPSERSETQRKELKDWMARKQARNIAEYKKRRDELAEREPHPYQPPKDAQTQLGATHKIIKKAEQARDGKRRTNEEEHFNERTKAARQLMSEIISDTPKLPTHQESHTRPVKKSSKPADKSISKPTSSRIQRAQSHDARRNRQQQSTVPKGTYLFIDSGSYPGRPPSSGSHGNDHHRHQTWKETSMRSEVNRRVPPIQIDYSSDEDLGFLDRISEQTESKENERPGMSYKQKSFKDIVRVQRPEVTRNKRSSPRKPKTYGDMLKELKQETNRPGSSNTLKAKQRLYGSRRIPGSQKRNERKSPRVAKPYTERLAEMKGNTQTLSRLKVRPKSKRPSFGTDTVTLDASFRRQQVERRGLRAETTPRTSTPYTERLAMLSNSGTFQARDGVVSPAPKLGLKYKPINKQANNYVDRLHETSATAPRPRHKSAYVGALGSTYKSPQLHTPSPRHRPYRVPSQDDQWDDEQDPWRVDDDEGALSGMSDVSPWSMSDEVKRILQGGSKESLGRGYTTDDDLAGLDSFDEQDDYLASVDLRELEEIASIGSESLINMNWSDIDKMIADVE